MKISRVTILPLAAAIVLGSAACGFGEPSDDRPDTPKVIREMYIDPEGKTCTRYKKGVCKSYKTDDKDWVIVTVDGKQYDVEEDEYNSVKVGDSWPVNG